MRLEGLLHGADAECDGLSFKYQPEQWPRQDSLDGFISALAARYAAKARFSKLMPDLWTDFAKGATTIWAMRCSLVESATSRMRLRVAEAPLFLNNFE